MHNGFEGCFVASTVTCPHCGNDADPTTAGDGTGCRDCGYTGKRRVRDWVPFEDQVVEYLLHAEREDVAPGGAPV